MLEKKLKKLGLSDKESRVYLAALELGISSVQELAKKSGVNRATTYIQVESLIKRGLMSKVDKANKTLFLAERPQRILEILEKKKESIESLENTFSKLMPEFEAIYNVKMDKPRVRFYENEVGNEFFRNAMVREKPEQIFWIVPKPPPRENKESIERAKQFLMKLKNVKILYFAKENIAMPRYIKDIPTILMKFFTMPDFEIEIGLFNNKIYIHKPAGDVEGMSVLIEDRIIYENFVQLFNVFWAMSQDIKLE